MFHFSGREWSIHKVNHWIESQRNHVKLNSWTNGYKETCPRPTKQTTSWVISQMPTGNIRRNHVIIKSVQLLNWCMQEVVTISLKSLSHEKVGQHLHCRIIMLHILTISWITYLLVKRARITTKSLDWEIAILCSATSQQC